MIFILFFVRLTLLKVNAHQSTPNERFNLFIFSNNRDVIAYTTNIDLVIDKKT